MAQTMVYTCDICKQSRDEKSLAKISVQARGIKIEDCDNYNPLKIDICSECLKKKGFIVEFKGDSKEQVEKQNRKTLEDKLFDILEDMGVVFEA